MTLLTAIKNTVEIFKKQNELREKDIYEALGKAVDTMAQRHVKTHVKPEHYPMVGTSLLEAIKDVLGDAATDDVINAWKEAYFFLGDILIAREKDIYAGK